MTPVPQLPEHQDLFREEALAQYRSGTGELGEVLRVTSLGVPWTLILLASLCGAALALGWLGTVGEYATGPAMVQVSKHSTSVVASFSSEALPLLRPGLDLHIRLRNGTDVKHTFVIREVCQEPIPLNETKCPSAADRQKGSPHRETSVYAEALTHPSSVFQDRMEGTAEVRLGSRRIVDALLPAFRALFGGDPSE